ncbi:MAG: hypothetical protein ABIJ95_12065 [Pseudomonadota bacterium]
MKFFQKNGTAAAPKQAGVTEGVLRSVFLAYLVLVLHLTLVLGLGLMMLFFHGVILYLPWIFAGGSALLILSAYGLYKKAQREGKTLGQILKDPLLAGRPVEVSILGGLAALRIGRPERLGEIPGPMSAGRLEDPWAARARELAELTRLLDQDLISPEEYKKARQGILLP